MWLREDRRSHTAGVVGLAVAALVARHAGEDLRRVPAVVAHDPALSHVEVACLHLCVQGLEELVHVKDGRRAYGTRELVVLQHLVEAVEVHGVATPEHRRLPQRIKHVLVADGAVVLHRVLDAAVLVAQGRRVAGSTLLAVEEVVLSTDSADAAIVAMELLLVNVIVQEVALSAEVLPHADAAVAAHLRDRLLGVTDEADDLCGMGGEEEKSAQEEAG